MALPLSAPVRRFVPLHCHSLFIEFIDGACGGACGFLGGQRSFDQFGTDLVERPRMGSSTAITDGHVPTLIHLPHDLISRFDAHAGGQAQTGLVRLASQRPCS